MEYPKVSILTPSYNRRKFLSLITHNLLNMDYDKSKLEWCILDDGKEPFFTPETLEETRKTLSPLKINYKYETQKRDIGVKRNALVKSSKNKICIMMDDDDIYFSSYIKHSIETLKKHNVGLVGSNHMLFIYPKHNYDMSIIECQAKRQIHEATLCFTKKYFNSMQGFKKNSQGEGVGLIDFNDKNVENIPIDDLMVCIVHKGQTLSIYVFYEYNHHVQPYIEKVVIKNHSNLIDSLDI